eukprot:766818-Hanusia_phi.AAC.2
MAVSIAVSVIVLYVKRSFMWNPCMYRSTYHNTRMALALKRSFVAFMSCFHSQDQIDDHGWLITLVSVDVTIITQSESG